MGTSKRNTMNKYSKCAVRCPSGCYVLGDVTSLNFGLCGALRLELDRGLVLLKALRRLQGWSWKDRGPRRCRHRCRGRRSSRNGSRLGQDWRLSGLERCRGQEGGSGAWRAHSTCRDRWRARRQRCVHRRLRAALASDRTNQDPHSNKLQETLHTNTPRTDTLGQRVTTNLQTTRLKDRFTAREIRAVSR